MRLPLNQVGSLNKISKAFSKFEQENERRPSPEELADELEIPVDKISDTLKVSGRHISVDAPFVEGEDNSLLDVLVNDDSPMADRSLVNESLSREIDRALSTLTEREKDIIQMFFGINTQEMTLEEIGDKFGLTRERVRQIKEKAIRRLRQNSRSKICSNLIWDKVEIDFKKQKRCMKVSSDLDTSLFVCRKAFSLLIYMSSFGFYA